MKKKKLMTRSTQTATGIVERRGMPVAAKTRSNTLAKM